MASTSTLYKVEAARAKLILAVQSFEAEHCGKWAGALTFTVRPSGTVLTANVKKGEINLAPT
eukprot:7185967-Alexandrium_andersonii.AAC.1